MKPSLWQRLLSHVVELHVESAPSELNPHLYVSLSRGRYQLSTKNAIYSFQDLYENFGRAFAAIDWSRFDPSEALILGFGLGSIMELLERNHHLQLQFTGVEADENVAYLAKKYILDSLHSPLSMHIADAYDFVLASTERYDMICMDVFVDDVIPEEMRTKDFIQSLKNLLQEDGLLMYNCLARTKQDVTETREILNRAFLKVFPDGGYLDVRGNWMLMSRTDVLK